MRFLPELAGPAASFDALSARWLVVIVAGLLGLAGIFVSVVALARAEGRLGTHTGPRGAFIALATGLISVALSGVVVATSDADYPDIGRVGATVVLLLGLWAVFLGWHTLARSRLSALAPRRPNRKRSARYW